MIPDPDPIAPRPQSIGLVVGGTMLLTGVLVGSLAGLVGGAFWAVFLGSTAAWSARTLLGRTIRVGERINELLHRFETETGVAAESTVDNAATVATRLPGSLSHGLARMAVNIAAAAYLVALADFRPHVRSFISELANDAAGERVERPFRQLKLAVQMFWISAVQRLGRWTRTQAPHLVRQFLTVMAFDGPTVVSMTAPVAGLAAHYFVSGGVEAVWDKLETLAVVVTIGGYLRLKYRNWRRLRQG